MSKRLSNEKGSLLMITYMIIVVFVVFGAIFVVSTGNDRLFAERQRLSTQALYIAEAGIERAIYDLREDFINDPTPEWDDGNINGMMIGPNTASFFTVSYTGTTLNNGSYTVELKNVAGQDDIWIRSTGTLNDITETLLVYASMSNVAPWNNAIFGGAGAAGGMVNGNVNIRGSVHILGENLAPTDLAVDLGGTADLIGNNYDGLSASLLAKVPALPTVDFNGETVSTLNAELRVKHGLVGLSGSATAGNPDVFGDSEKETIDGSFVTDGFGGSMGTANVYSDNGWSNNYDLGDSVTFPSLSDPYGAYSTYQAYLKANALVINNAADLAQLSSITPTSSFSYSNANGSISMDGSGNMAISGIVYVEGGNFNMSKQGAATTINYTGVGSILVEGTSQIDLNLVTPGNSSYPTNIMAVMTPNSIGFNEANIDVMGLFYAEDTVVIQKQTDIMGTIVTNYFDMGTNVPSIFQVPETANNLPAGLIGNAPVYSFRIVSWQKQ
ncbi:MAG TPA: hypothetical protein VI749_09565 [Candidatus Omnitrophota bacterium]|nr:hypothetical protein [Candidatus Omnitrophota bacterium]